MQRQNSTQLTLDIDAKTFELLNDYCTEFGRNKTEVLEELIQQNLQESIARINAMKKGYEDMGVINLEICSAFSDCEDEAHMDI